MTPYIILSTEPPVFPDNLKPVDHTGLVALGGELTIPILIEAYSKGIFPWSGDDPVPWYSPDPRLILIPDMFHVSRRLQRIISSNRFGVKFDTDFSQIIRRCATIERKNQDGTWINERIIDTYETLFSMKIGHCVGIYEKNTLCGGLYGLSLGKCFFGESMFSDVSNASKLALYHLSCFCRQNNFTFIDCQQVTPHLMSLGAFPVPRSIFINLLNISRIDRIYAERWQYP
jgi:leucyl/phenylalanyl-tRNA--protein transferase